MEYGLLSGKVYTEEQVETWLNEQVTDLPIEAICHKCNATENLKYHKPWSIGRFNYGNYCECDSCRQELEDRIRREEAMKYLIIDNYREDQHFADNKEEVEEYFKDHYLDEPWDYVETVRNDIVILKLQALEGPLKAEMFEFPNRTHIVLWDCEPYRVEEVIKPQLEDTGRDFTLEW